MKAKDKAVAALHAWNNVPNNGFFEFPRDFPQGSCDAWRRVVVAISDATIDECLEALAASPELDQSGIDDVRRVLESLKHK
jgi:hypothetical protein